MSIPFGSVALAAGLVSWMFGNGKQGFVLAGAGVLAAAFFSLVQWRAQRPSTTFNLISAGKRHQQVPVLSCLSMVNSCEGLLIHEGLICRLAWNFMCQARPC